MYNQRWRDGIWVGKAPMTDEHFIHDGEWSPESEMGLPWNTNQTEHEQRRQQQQQHSQLSQEALMAWVEKQRATFVVRPRLVSLSESVKELITLD